MNNFKASERMNVITAYLESLKNIPDKIHRYINRYMLGITYHPTVNKKHKLSPSALAYSYFHHDCWCELPNKMIHFDQWRVR